MNNNDITPPPSSLSEQRPADPFTAQDGARLFTAIDAFSKRVESAIEKEGRETRNAIAGLMKNIITLLEAQARIEAGLVDSRVNRLELDLQEAEIERAQAEEALRKAEEKLSGRQAVKDKTIDTQDRLRTIASSALADVEKQREDERRKRLDDIKLSMLKTALNWGVVAIIVFVMGFLGYLFRLYITSGSP